MARSRRRRVRRGWHLPSRGSRSMARSACLMLGVVMSVVMSVAVAAAQNFEAVIRLPIRLGVDHQGEPRHIGVPAVGDLNNDGFNDVVLTAMCGNPRDRSARVFVLLNNRHGSFVNGTRRVIVGSADVDWGGGTRSLKTSTVTAAPTSLSAVSGGNKTASAVRTCCFSPSQVAGCGT